MSCSLRVAIVANTGLGDALWMMVLAHSFWTAGYSVVLYSDFLCHLESLFPHLSIQPYPKQEKRASIFAKFDRIIFQHHSPGSKDRPLPPHSRVLYKETFDLRQSYVWNLQRVCEEEIGFVESDMGLLIPQNWKYRSHQKRIVIHPLSADSAKNWRASQFIKLAKKLKSEGYEPQVILPPSDKETWQPLLKKAALADPVCLHWLPLAKYLYESGYFIGNDASPGHLASLLQIPTLSLFSRKSRAVLYRPDFGKGEVVLPYPCLPGRWLRHKFWQHFLPVNRALKAFCSLRSHA